MEIWHRIGFNADVNPSFKALLEQLEINYKVSSLPGHVIGIVYFDITESDLRWIKIQERVRKEGASNVYTTVFTHDEILAAEWVRLVPTFEKGYPQPEDDWKQITYEGICSQCGAGYWQKAPFRLKKEPRMGKNDFLCLYWTYTLFCKPHVIEALKAQEFRGFEVWDALLHRTNQPSEIVSQLVIPTVAKPGLADEDKLQPETCAQCGITKYRSHLRGYMHLERDALDPTADFQLTYEWFGSGGHMGYREFLISQRVARLILDKGWRGVAMKPVKLV